MPARKFEELGDRQLTLSSDRYLAATMLEGKTSKDARTRKVQIKAASNCDHVETICSLRECVNEWMKYWSLDFNSTAGGRKLARLVYPERES